MCLCAAGPGLQERRPASRRQRFTRSSRRAPRPRGSACLPREALAEVVLFKGCRRVSQRAQQQAALPARPRSAYGSRQPLGCDAVHALHFSSQEKKRKKIMLKKKKKKEISKISEKSLAILAAPTPRRYLPHHAGCACCGCRASLGESEVGARAVTQNSDPECLALARGPGK